MKKICCVLLSFCYSILSAASVPEQIAQTSPDYFEQKNIDTTQMAAEKSQDDLVYHGEEHEFHDLVYRGETVAVIPLTDASEK